MTSISRPASLGRAPAGGDDAADGYALSPLQEGMLFHWLLDRHSGVDIEQIVGHLGEPIDPGKLERAWQGAVDHFSTLRTAFAWEGLPAPHQNVRATAQVPFTSRDLRQHAPEDQERMLDEILRNDRRAGFDLASAPLMRVSLFRLAEARFRMIWTFHHILIDGRAFEVILNDVFATYAGRPTHAQADRPYHEYIDWITRQDHGAARTFWDGRLAGFTTPSRMASSLAEASDAEVVAERLPDVQLSHDGTQRLRALAKREGLSLNSILLAAWAYLVAQQTGNHDVVFGASKTTRRGTIPDADTMIGMFLATVPVRVTVDPTRAVADWLRAVRAEWLSIRGNEHLPLVAIRRASEVPPSSALFDSLVVFENAQLDTLLLAQGGAWTHRKFATFEQTSVPLTLLAYGDDALTMRLEFDSRRVNRSDAIRWLAHVEELLVAWGADATRPLSESPALVMPASGEPVLSAGSTQPRVADQLPCVHEQFEAQVARTPHAVAVVFGDVELTYRQVNAHANRIARDLRNRGARPGTLIGICMDRSAEMVVALLAILKSGAAYVPLDPVYPPHRLAMMLEDARVHTIVTQQHLTARLGDHGPGALFVDGLPGDPADEAGNVVSGVGPDDLAYVIFTSGSTGRPKGTMIEHRNVANFLAGMDEVIAPRAPGVWLAVTSISFDISVLELFWTLARGFEVVVAPAQDRASLEQRVRRPGASTKPMEFGLFYFAAHSGHTQVGDAYRLLIEGAKFADEHGFAAVWTPERHFHAFGGFYPNPAVTTAALSTITSRVQLRAGSIVLPLHNPLRVAEDWAVIDQLSGGRVGLSFASGWHVNDFAFMPGNFERRREVMNESIETVLKLWRGETISVPNGAGKMIDVSVLPRPIQSQPPIWIASAGSVDTFVLAGRLGANVLTNMLGQDLADLKVKFAAYHNARREHGHAGSGIISVMLHTFVTDDSDEARRLARKPFSEYLASSYDLVKLAPTMFPAFRQPSRHAGTAPELDHAAFTDEDMAALLDHAFDRYFDTAGLFGTPERALALVDQLAEIGATEVACLIDFGIDSDKVIESLVHLDRLRRICAERSAAPSQSEEGSSIAALIRRRGVTHLQCTPSIARALADDPDALAAMGGLDTLLLGGEALPPDLAERLSGVVRGRILNMYGPTETTVWSTTASVTRGASPTIGRAIRNTFLYVLDEQRHKVAMGTPGELYIGGDGVVRGYLDRPELTAERFLPDPFSGSGRMYRTGDLVRQRVDGALEYLGRIDDQVKIDGFRIELGEIEATLARHSSVRQAVVVAHAAGAGEAGASQRLFAYIVPANAGADADRIGVWQQLWNETYERSVAEDAAADPRFRIAGWNDSYTGQPIPATEMREWVQNTAARIVALKPRRVLEIGCGTGLVLYRVLPHVDHYTGLDISPAALDSIRRELTAAEAHKVTLVEGAADHLAGIPPRSVDLVVINSVAQYFPNASYLEGVLRRATELVSDGGHIFIGDVRSLEHLELFHTALELSQASESDVEELRTRITQRVAHESELVVSPAFFDALLRSEPRLNGLDVQLKRGTARNEMTMFRYDVVMTVNGPAHAPSAEIRRSTARDLPAIIAELDTRPEYVYLVDVPNARLSGVSAATSVLHGSAPVRMEELRVLLDGAGAGVDPEALHALSADHDVSIRWAQSGHPGHFDALLRRTSSGQPAAWPAPVAAASEARHTNTPASRHAEATLTGQLRAHLRQTLPEFMIPASFTMLATLPLTPNGKIDRKALPLPTRQVAPLAATYAAPSGDLEQVVADVWRDLLALDQVGRKDNIFDLGANSLLAMQANSRLSALFGRSIPLVNMFRYPTVASLAAYLSEGVTKAPTPGPDKRTRDRSARSEEAAERRRALRAERERQ